MKATSNTTFKPFVTTLTTTNMASCTSPPWPRISRQPLHGNIRHFQNGPDSTSRLILGAVTRGIFTVLNDHFTARSFVGVCDRTFPRNISRVKYPWISKKVPCYLLWWRDFALLDKLHLKIVFRKTFEIVRFNTHQIIWENVCIFFAGEIRIWFHSFVFLILSHSEISEIPLGYIIMFSFYPGDQQFLKPKIPLAMKVLQVFPGKIIASKQKLTVVNKFTCNRKSPW